MSAHQEEKTKLRSLFLAKREALNEALVKDLSCKISQKIFKFLILQRFTKLAFYMAKGKEVSLSKAIGKFFVEGKKVYLPKTWLKERRLTFHRVYSFSDLVPGPFGLLEPNPKNEVADLGSLEVIFIPGLAFDVKGYRLGYGGGFYDRVLREMSALKVGVCYYFQLVESLPIEPHDVPVDLILTEDGIIRCQKP
ncbi:MAG: 5-formyltetrahydrofolate cyclo-ligase [Thermodesulfobacterium sp.]|nr:5-formyltetrahydrofolate cyclo-ligase [Thermodesulfobacterium sp.]